MNYTTPQLLLSSTITLSTAAMLLFYSSTLPMWPAVAPTVFGFFYLYVGLANLLQIITQKD